MWKHIYYDFFKAGILASLTFTPKIVTPNTRAPPMKKNQLNDKMNESEDENFAVTIGKKLKDILSSNHAFVPFLLPFSDASLLLFYVSLLLF